MKFYTYKCCAKIVKEVVDKLMDENVPFTIDKDYEITVKIENRKKLNNICHNIIKS
jgi:hypothetical protein